MTPLTREWIAKAEGDFRTAQRELHASDQPNYDAVCFHAQQCAEKYLKALLQEEGVAFPKMHDLSQLLKLTLSFAPELQSLKPSLEALTDFAVEFRYPGESADQAIAKTAFADCAKTRERIRSRLFPPLK